MRVAFVNTDGMNAPSGQCAEMWPVSKARRRIGYSPRNISPKTGVATAANRSGGKEQPPTAMHNDEIPVRASPAQAR